MEEVKIIRCLEECGKEWRLKQGKFGQQKQKEEETREEKEEEKEENEQKKKWKQKKRKTMQINKVVEEWEIWNKEEKVARSEEEVEKLVLERFYK